MKLFFVASLLIVQSFLVSGFKINAGARQKGDEDNDFISYDDNTQELKVRWSFIFPATKWCGTGDVASSYNDLGENWETDICCRDHDLCSDIIPAGGTKHGLTNKALHSKLSCKCDDKFRECLKETKSMSSDIVGVFYFDILSTQCFRKTWFGYNWHDVESYFK